ncbi:rho GTPase-activating protein 7 isoform X2 [Kryptolebias marmoratus]|uniref:rho GTPase-activating protein 7 isoform X2 n=1 Tax=Kryptolebias marmoratus TaxID=37003 RepID=UPI0018ACB8D8|nr:rho GTPase-activating protein 7 isoform X2 [Kryptolebias marmoratus]
MSQPPTGRSRLRRSFSEHVKDSTNRAWDGFWRSVRERRLWEIEAREACDWLRAAGFPQYLQLLADRGVPVDVETAKRDHCFLDEDCLSSLCRRLITLNKCLEMKLELQRSKLTGDDWDEEDFCAISPSWTFDRRARRWRRLASDDDDGLRSSGRHDRDGVSAHSSNGTDSDGHDERPQETSGTSSHCSSTNPTRSPNGPPSPGGGSSSVSLEAKEGVVEKPPRKKRTALLRRVERLRLRVDSPRRVRRHIHGPVLVPDSERTNTLHFLLNPQARSGSRSSSAPSSPPTVSSGSSNSQSESSSAVSTPSPIARVRSNCKRSNSGVGATRTHQNRPEPEVSRNQNQNNDGNHDNLVFQVPQGHKPGTFPSSLAHKHILSPIVDDTSVNWRTGSFHGYRGQRGSRRGVSSLAAAEPSPASPGRPAAPHHRLSVYDNVPDDARLSESSGGSDAERKWEEPEVRRLTVGEDVFSALDDVLERIGDIQQLVSSWSENVSEEDLQRGSSSSSSTHSHIQLQEPEEPENPSARSPRPRRRASRQLRWSSEQNPSPGPGPGPGLEVQSVSQVLLLQKLSLLKLTALMDKFSPSSKQGWSWSVPKAQRKSKATEVKGCRVFGVPLLVSAQRTGEPLPPCVLRALVYLKTECLDQVGLFRKSGVKSRIKHLREMVESDPDGVSYEGQSAFDVADMVKQFFRDLPEPVFSSQLCETFLHIYQYFPKDQQLVAAQAAILLLPEESRAALRTLLLFLRDVVTCVSENQMTPTNIAVCLAPSLFHLSSTKRSSGMARSGHRKSSLGRPDQRDLSETLAATQGLAHMIAEAQRLFQLPEFWPRQSLNAPGPTEDRGEEDKWTRLQLRTRQLLEEVQDEGQDWEDHPGPEQVGDGCPLWMWRGSVEVDAPQQEVLRRLLREQHLWEENLRHAAVLRTLSEDTEVYRCVLQGQGHALGSQPPLDHLLLRTWRADPSSGPLYLSSVSTDDPEVPPEGIRVLVHACLYLLEPAGTTRTRLTHLCRTDTRGRAQDWYCKAGRLLLASGLLAIRDSFRTKEEKD